MQTQQDTIRQMAKYNRLLSQRVAAYASEINRLKALVAKLQRMQFGKSSEKLRAKTERQIPLLKNISFSHLVELHEKIIEDFIAEYTFC
ncbi:Transposase (plasmid) [Shigella dysenteriae WRSd3]|uniref:Transposase n=1 Tax=Shigella dysenteriae WRSd3 TaxID=1401327 RepID=A0A090NVF2_SHIDY|nr:Transposase [Shigella dysenteriae WRSd3]ESU76668.1 Transposase [Shigella dysenteriae WRSd5]